MKGQLWTWNPYEGHRHDPVCCVYRVYDPVTRELLYVGQTCRSLKGRIKDHWKSKPWFVWHWNSAMVTYEESEGYWSSMIAEAEAILEENPRYNVERPDPDVLRAWAREAEVSA